MRFIFCVLDAVEANWIILDPENEIFATLSIQNWPWH